MKKRLTQFWSGKSVVITGASSGLGWSVIEALAPYQINFCLLSRREDRMLELALKLKDFGSRFWISRCDVRNRDEVMTAIQNFYRQTGRIDVAWVNSGVVSDTSYDLWDWKSVEAMIDTNLKGAIYTIRACLELMVPQGYGTIVGIGSAVSMRGLPTRSIYSMTKIGLDYFINSLAVELPEIQFTIIHPGFVDTPINQESPYRLWLMDPERAARLMIKAVVRRRNLYIYPYRMSLLYRFVRSLPTPIYQFIARKAIDFRRQKIQLLQNIGYSHSIEMAKN